jgi:hypothetical protein
LVERSRVIGDLLVFNRDACEIAEPGSCARFDAESGLPLLNDVRN